MTALFLSHANADDPLARSLEAWLGDHGLVAIGGGPTPDALRDPNYAGAVFICVVTEAWLADGECSYAFRVAWSTGLRLFPLFALSDGERADPVELLLQRVRQEAAGADLSPLLTDGRELDPTRDQAHAEALLQAIHAAGLDPLAFEPDPASPLTPFPGLMGFDDDGASASIYFGRDQDIALALRALRALRASRDRRVLALVGVPGAGAASLLRAGVLPRLRRESATWLPLRAFRPGPDPLARFAEAWVRTLDGFGGETTVEQLRDELLTAWSTAPRQSGRLTPEGRAAIGARLAAEAQRARDVARRPDATVLIAIDRAEALADGSSEEAEALTAYLRAAVDGHGDVRVFIAVRADKMGSVQSHPRFEGMELLAHDVRPLPVGRWGPAIVGPARRCGLEIDDGLVSALKADAPAQDGLPLLAFGLQRLWWKFAADGAISVEDYRSTGILPSMLEGIADRALLGPGRPDDDDGSSTTLDDLGARTFVPSLVDVDERGQRRSLPAAWSSFDEAQQAVLERFVSARLVRRDDDGRLELAHDAVVSHWPRLRRWLDAELERRDELRALRAAAWAWSNTGQDDQVSHRGPSLRAAEALRDHPRLGASLTAVERAYLDACAEVDRPSPASTGTLRTVAIAAVAAVLGAALAVAAVGRPEPGQWWARLSGTNGRFAHDLVPSSSRSYVADQFTPHVLTAAVERALRDGDRFRECKRDCPEMIVVPGGRFAMGDGEGQWAFAMPVHPVTISERFAVSRQEITFEDWGACVQHGRCPPADDAGFGTDRRPVINVSWNDAQTYVAWLSEVTGRRYRLLSEAEWEYAARSASDTPFWWGKEAGLGRASCRNCGTDHDGVRTATVASFQANSFGLFDVHGNVWEWVEDCWHRDYAQAPAGGEAWKDADGGDCDKAVIRGGSWQSSWSVMRAAARDWYRRDAGSATIGFRVARVLRP